MCFWQRLDSCSHSLAELNERFADVGANACSVGVETAVACNRICTICSFNLQTISAVRGAVMASVLTETATSFKGLRVDTVEAVGAKL